MENKFYQVFEIDNFFSDYGTSTVIVGALDKEDLLKHFEEIFPPFEYELKSQEDIECWGLGGSNYKIGDVIKEESEEMQHFKDFEDGINDTYGRIQVIDNLYTDKPYTILTRSGYLE